MKYTEEELKETCLAWAKTYAQDAPFSQLNLLGIEKCNYFDEWLKKRNKPDKKKIIDLEPLIASGIDCEFSDSPNFRSFWIGKLADVSKMDFSIYSCNSGDGMNGSAVYCRPRMNHKMCWDGSKPIEGFIVKAYFDRASSWSWPCSTTEKSINWPHVKAIEFLGVEDGYAYPWEKSE